jgi:hypothetical protein
VHGVIAANSSLAPAQGKNLVTGPSLVQTIISTSSSSGLNYRLTLIQEAVNEWDTGGDKERKRIMKPITKHPH